MTDTGKYVNHMISNILKQSIAIEILLANSFFNYRRQECELGLLTIITAKNLYLQELNSRVKILNHYLL